MCEQNQQTIRRPKIAYNKVISQLFSDAKCNFDLLLVQSIYLKLCDVNWLFILWMKLNLTY